MTAAVVLPVGTAVPTLTRWGLSSDADLVYRTLATFGPRQPRTLATELGLSRRRVEHALAELQEYGAASAVRAATPQTPIWQGRAAGDVVEALRRRRLRLVDRQSQAQRHHGLVRVVGARLRDAGLSVPALGGTMGDSVRYLRTRTLLRERLGELVAQERREHLAINTEQEFDATAKAGMPLTCELVDRGIRQRVLGPPPADGDALDPLAHLLDREPYQYRESLDIPLKLFLCDRKVALFPVDPLDFERGYLEVDDATVVDALVVLFEKHWEKAVDPQRHGVPAIVLSERELAIVTLLAQGHTDVATAAALQLSPRSITATLRGLMDRLAVENRFQLGLALGAMRVTAPPSLQRAQQSAEPASRPAS